VTVWLVRAGKAGAHARRCHDHGVIALGWPCVGDVRDEDPDDVPRAVQRFAHDISEGDLVVTPDSPAGEVLIGEVTGDYRWVADSPVPDHRHLRPVEWIDEVPKEALPPRAQGTVNYYAATVLRLKDDHPLATFARDRQRTVR
jgi:predicted Mrr-cat superfamily restriction endonuclease